MYNSNIYPYAFGMQNYNPAAQSLMQQPQTQGILPHCQILTASGQSSIDNLRMEPNSSVLIAHATEPIVWKCVSDSLGNVTSEIFDVTPHKEAPKVDMYGLEKRVATIEQILINMNQEEQKNEPSAGKKQRAAGKQSGGESQAD